jgi:spermidine synthase
MLNSVFIEHHSNGIACYINGDLQFDTADEAIYHEYLVIPTVALAIKRFPNTGLKVLICGGGDGLAARDVLRFPEVISINLVDYNSDILDLARTVFKTYNKGSLANKLLTVHTQEAFEFIATVPDCDYHAVIADFTYPTCPEDTKIYSQEWFQQVQRILIPGGLISTNGVSPENRTAGFWCLYQTILSAGLWAKPLEVEIPSFQQHGYGIWGLFLASEIPIQRSEIQTIPFPQNLQAISHNNLLKSFQFPAKIAQFRHDIPIHSLTCPQLFYFLLNPLTFLTENPEISSKIIDFLDWQEAGNEILGTSDRLQLESIIRAWFEQDEGALNDHDNTPPPNLDINRLLPVQHRYHGPEMTKEWLSYLKQLLAEIDLSRLLKSLLDRSQDLPPKLAQDIKKLADGLRAHQQVFQVSPQVARFITILGITLLLANLSHPDSVFAKGYYYSGWGSSSSDTDNESNLKPLGIMLMILGGRWLFQILNQSDDN